MDQGSYCSNVFSFQPSLGIGRCIYWRKDVFSLVQLSHPASLWAPFRSHPLEGGCLGVAYTAVWVLLVQLRNAEDRVGPQPFPSPRRPLTIRPRQDTPSARVLDPGRAWAELQTSRAHIYENILRKKFILFLEYKKIYEDLLLYFTIHIYIYTYINWIKTY